MTPRQEPREQFSKDKESHDFSPEHIRKRDTAILTDTPEKMLSKNNLEYVNRKRINKTSNQQRQKDKQKQKKKQKENRLKRRKL